MAEKICIFTKGVGVCFCLLLSFGVVSSNSPPACRGFGVSSGTFYSKMRFICELIYVSWGFNLGRTVGVPFITTSYDYDAPIDEYDLIGQPKYDHLKELRKAFPLYLLLPLSGTMNGSVTGKQFLAALVKFAVNKFQLVPEFFKAVLWCCTSIIRTLLLCSHCTKEWEGRMNVDKSRSRGGFDLKKEQPVPKDGSTTHIAA